MGRRRWAAGRPAPVVPVGSETGGACSVPRRRSRHGRPAYGDGRAGGRVPDPAGAEQLRGGGGGADPRREGEDQKREDAGQGHEIGVCASPPDHFADGQAELGEGVGDIEALNDKAYRGGCAESVLATVDKGEISDSLAARHPHSHAPPSPCLSPSLLIPYIPRLTPQTRKMPLCRPASAPSRRPCRRRRPSGASAVRALRSRRSARPPQPPDRWRRSSFITARAAASSSSV